MSSSIRQSILYSQNFLKDPCLIASLLDRLDIRCDDVVYEIGPGKGIITEQLALRYKQVIAIEKDPRLAALLLQQFAHRSNVTIHAGDFLHYPLRVNHIKWLPIFPTISPLALSPDSQQLNVHQRMLI
jgi:16S rRNA A1518/A1519 N6-dimethyltransferase RsmA/KsgA/DIM1 with predicted DNA glycosylase/AP lyase activity